MTDYFIALLIIFLLWLLFLVSDKNKIRTILTSFLIAPFVIIDILLVPAYWNPETFADIPVGVEGFIFTFFISGICLSLANRFAIAQPKLHSARLYPAILAAMVFSFFAIFSSLAVHLKLFLIMGLSGILLLGEQNIKTFSILKIILSFTTLYTLAFNIWLFFAPSAIEWWNPNNTTGIYVIKMPIEEMLFAICFAIFISTAHIFGRIYKESVIKSSPNS